jgi:predicted transcriptional regulator
MFACMGEPTAGDSRAAEEAGPPAARPVTRLADPRALRAYAHPVRLALVELLRTEGPLTATRAAGLLGESSGTCSFHLRQLAKYGLVEEAGGGTGRQKPWRATTMFTDVPAVADTPELAAASRVLRSVLVERYFERVMRWLDRRPAEPPEWQQAAQLGDWLVYLTADELAGLGRQVSDLLEPYLDRTASPALRPAAARQVTWLQLAIPGELGDPGAEGG